MFWTKIKMLVAKTISLFVNLGLWLHAKQLKNTYYILGHHLLSWKQLEKVNECIQEYAELKQIFTEVLLAHFVRWIKGYGRGA